MKKTSKICYIYLKYMWIHLDINIYQNKLHLILTSFIPTYIYCKCILTYLDEAPKSDRVHNTEVLAKHIPQLYPMFKSLPCTITMDKKQPSIILIMIRFVLQLIFLKKRTVGQPTNPSFCLLSFFSSLYK